MVSVSHLHPALDLLPGPVVTAKTLLPQHVTSGKKKKKNNKNNNKKNSDIPDSALAPYKGISYEVLLK